MFNLIKADMYRLSRTTSYYVVGAILGFFVTIVMYALGEISDPSIDISKLQLVDLLYNCFMNTFFLMIIGIEGAIFICTDYSSGYIKNIASGINHKASITISKFITYAIGTLLYFLFIIIAAFILGNILIGKISIGDISVIAKYIGMVYFLTLVTIGMVVLASSIFRNSAGSITTLVLIILLLPLAYTVLNHFLGIDLATYSPIMNYQLLTPVNTDTWSKSILSGVGFLSVYLIAASIIMEKKDII